MLRLAATLAVFAPLSAHASQGPGVADGTASAVTQHVFTGSLAVAFIGLLAVAVIRRARA